MASLLSLGISSSSTLGISSFKGTVTGGGITANLAPTA